MRLAAPRRAFDWVRTSLPLLVLGVCSELIYLLYFVRQFPLLRFYRQSLSLGLIAGESPRAAATFIGEFALLFLLAGLAWRQVHNCQNRTAPWLVLGFGAVFAATMTFMYPATYLDLYMYISGSWLMVHYHRNPLLVPVAHYPHDPLFAYAARFPPDFTVQYGPLGVVLDAMPTMLVGQNLLASLILLKVMFSAMALVSAFLIYRVVERLHPGRAVGGALLVAWNPLIVFQISGYGHNDAAAMVLALLALLSATHGERILGPVLLAASALVKFSTGLLIPLLLAYCVARVPRGRRQVAYLVSVVLVVSVVVVVVYAPFWQGTPTLRKPLTDVERYYTGSFAAAVSAPFSSVLPAVQARLAGRLLFIPFYVYTIWLASRSLLGLLRGCYIAMLLFLALGAGSVEAWYFVWTCMLAATVPLLADSLSAFALGFTAMVSVAADNFLWPWLAEAHAGAAFLGLTNTVSYLITFTVPLLLFVLLLYRSPGLGTTKETQGSDPATIAPG